MRLIKFLSHPKQNTALVVVNFILIGTGVFSQQFLPPQIPLFYGNPSGIDQLAGKSWIMLLPVLALVVTIINSSIASSVSENFLKITLLGVSVLFTTLSTITMVKIIFLVGNI